MRMLCFYDHWLTEIIFGGEYLDFWHLFIFALMFVADTELLLVEQQHRLHTDGQCFWQCLLEFWLILTNRQLPYLDKLRSACYHPKSLIPHIKNIQPLNAWWFSLDFCLRFVAYYIIDFDAAEVLTFSSSQQKSLRYWKQNFDVAIKSDVISLILLVLCIVLLKILLFELICWSVNYYVFYFDFIISLTVLIIIAE